MRWLTTCRSHATAPELARSEYLTDQQQRAYDAEAEAHYPACWSWPSPTAQQLVPGIDEGDEVERMAEWQQNRCAVCGMREQSQSPLVQDHDHWTGLHRGLLCRSCNITEGRSPAYPVFVRYRQKNPASILGVRMLYTDLFGWHPDLRVAVPLTHNHASYIIARDLGGGE